MKLINKELNAEYSSPTLEWNNAWGCYRDYSPLLHKFYKDDGWKEVVDENHFVDEWHDLRKNPADLPSDDREVIVAGYYDYTICTEYAYNVDFYAAGQWQMDMEIVAWRDFPAFNEN